MTERDAFGAFNLFTLHVFSRLRDPLYSIHYVLYTLKIYKSVLFVYLNKHEEGSIALP